MESVNRTHIEQIESIKSQEFQRANRPLSEKIIMEGFPPCVESLMIQAMDIRSLSDVPDCKIDLLTNLVSELRQETKEGIREARRKTAIVNEIVDL